MKFTQNLFIILILTILFVCSVTTAWTHENKDQKIMRIGMIAFAEPFLTVCEGLTDGLKKYGYQQGNNIYYYIHHVGQDTSKIPALLNSFAENHVDLIFTVTTPVALAVKKKAAELKIPVIFTVVADPVGSNLVPSLKMPGAMSGVSHIAFELLPKRLLLFKEAFPRLRKVAIFFNPQERWLLKNVINSTLNAAATEAGLEIVTFHVKNEEDIAKVSDSISSRNIDGLFMVPDPLVASLFSRLVELSRREGLPLMVIDNIFLKKGGVLGYSPSFYDVGLQASHMVHSVLHGIPVGQLPIQNPDKVKLAVSLKEIERLGLDISDTFLSRADEILR